MTALTTSGTCADRTRRVHRLAEVIRLDGLGQRYGRRWVLRDLQLTVREGITVLLGPNGAGKTTLLSTIAGLRRPAAGTVSVLGRTSDGAAGRRALLGELGYLPQELGFHPGYTVSEFLMYSAWLKKVPPDDATELVRSALELTGLQETAGQRMKTLSGGTVRRVGIAQAIVHRPRLVLLDEPASGLDPHQRIEMRRLLRQLKDRTSAVVSTHHVDDLKSLADEVVVLSGGQIRFQGSPEELAARGSEVHEGDSQLERGYSAVSVADGGRS
jgi:ABC-2 type transport system ATP-binding protein